MKQTKNSKQRTAVLERLCSTTFHPTALELYEMVRSEMPNISLATVYRNLNLLCEEGRAIKLTADGADHFDGTVEPHYHFMCNGCKRVYDVEMEHDAQLDQVAQNATGGEITGHSLMFYGQCRHCLEQKN